MAQGFSVPPACRLFYKYLREKGGIKALEKEKLIELKARGAKTLEDETFEEKGGKLWTKVSLTEKGNKIASKLMSERMEKKMPIFEEKVKNLPKRFVSFVVKEFLKMPSFQIIYCGNIPEDLLGYPDIKFALNRFFEELYDAGLCIILPPDVTKHRPIAIGEGFIGVPEEVGKSLSQKYKETHLSDKAKDLLKCFEFLSYCDAEEIYIDSFPEMFDSNEEFIKEYAPYDDCIGAILKDAEKIGITSQYRGIYHADYIDKMPFDVKDPIDYRLYIESFE